MLYVVSIEMQCAHAGLKHLLLSCSPLCKPAVGRNALNSPIDSLKK